MGLAGIVVDTGTVMAPGVALGVTVDDVVHFMLMYRNGLKQGASRRDSIMMAYKGCARPMFQSWGVIGLGMSVFAMSPFTPTQRFGYLMVTLLTSALVGNLVVLPAVLASPLGALFGRRFQKARVPSELLTGLDRGTSRRALARHPPRPGAQRDHRRRHQPPVSRISRAAARVATAKLPPSRGLANVFGPRSGSGNGRIGTSQTVAAEAETPGPRR